MSQKSLASVVIFLERFPSRHALLALDGQDAISDTDLEIRLVHAGQFSGYLIDLFGLTYVDSGH